MLLLLLLLIILVATIAIGIIFNSVLAICIISPPPIPILGPSDVISASPAGAATAATAN